MAPGIAVGAGLCSIGAGAGTGTVRTGARLGDMMTAPTRKAWFGDAIGGRDEVEDPAYERQYIIERFASEADLFADWIVDESGLEVRLTVLERVPGRSVIGWTAGGAEGTVTFTPDPSGWILAVAEFGGREVGRGYIDHAYEWYDIFPPGATPDRDEEAPGHIGKKRSWVGLPIAAWPVLQKLVSGSASFTVSIDESKLRS